MRHRFLIAVILVLSIAQVERAYADTPAGSEQPPRSRLVAAMLERFAHGYDPVCFIGGEVSRGPKLRPFRLAPSFYERFVYGQLNMVEIDPSGCPAPERNTDTCAQGCVVVVVYDAGPLGIATSWTPWPECDQERISIVHSHRALPGKPVLLADIYRDGLERGNDLGGHNYLRVTETEPCSYLIQDEEVIE